MATGGGTAAQQLLGALGRALELKLPSSGSGSGSGGSGSAAAAGGERERALLRAACAKLDLPLDEVGSACDMFFWVK